jgi:hypothetical protein
MADRAGSPAIWVALHRQGLPSFRSFYPALDAWRLLKGPQNSTLQLCWFTRCGGWPPPLVSGCVVFRLGEWLRSGLAPWARNEGLGDAQHLRVCVMLRICELGGWLRSGLAAWARNGGLGNAKHLGRGAPNTGAALWAVARAGCRTRQDPVAALNRLSSHGCVLMSLIASDYEDLDRA